MARSWRSPQIRDRKHPPAQARDIADYQSRGRHLGAPDSAQAGQHDLQVGQVAALEPELVVDIADDNQRGSHSRNGPKLPLKHLT